MSDHGVLDPGTDSTQSSGEESPLSFCIDALCALALGIACVVGAVVTPLVSVPLVLLAAVFEDPELAAQKKARKWAKRQCEER